MPRTLAELQQRLKAQYQKNASIERLFYPENPLPLAQCFLELALIEEAKASKPKADNESDESKAITTKGAQSLSGREYFLQEYERIPTVSRTVPMNELMTLSQEPKKRWYVEGAAGAGKSTLTRYLAYNYTSSSPVKTGFLSLFSKLSRNTSEQKTEPSFLQQYQWVFLIRFRELTRDNYPSDKVALLDVIQRECLGLNDLNELNAKECQTLKAALNQHSEQVLFILDGYDEFNPETPALKNVWRTLITSDFHLILTSRPGTQLKKNELAITTNLVVMGFNDEQIKDYANHFFNPGYTPGANPEDKARCLSWLKQNPNLWSIAHIPIQLELLCSNYSSLQQQTDFTLSVLYDSLWHNLVKRCAAREKLSDTLLITDVEKPYQLHTQYLSHLAFLGMQNQKIVLSEEEIKAAYQGLSSRPANISTFLKPYVN